MPTSKPSRLYLFGGTKPFLPPPWITTDDRLRNGSSHSSLTALSNNRALFAGHLDTQTLGGAGFASQFSPDAGCSSKTTTAGANEDRCSGWDLTSYDGVEIELGRGDGKLYTLILKDEVPQRDEGSGGEKSGVSWEASGVSWEASVKAPLSPSTPSPLSSSNENLISGPSTKTFIPWIDFKHTYRGRQIEDGKQELKRGNVMRVGIMMRSYFGQQEGNFELEIRAVLARKEGQGKGEGGDMEGGWGKCVVS